MTTIFVLLTVQGLMGAFDNLWHHELTESLPSRPSAWRELTLHSARAFIYGIIFLALAWSQWQGAFAILLAVLMVIEVAITLWDFIEEDLTRKLPPLERVLHTLLALNYGAVLAFLAPVLWAWAQQPTAIAGAYHGLFTWILTLYGIGIIAWAVRDGLAALRLKPLVVPQWQRQPFAVPAKPGGHTVVVTGATGFIGRHTVRKLVARGDHVIVLTRDPDKAAYHFGPHARAVTALDDIAADEPVHAIVNLAGEPVVGLPWTPNRREEILNSRLKTTDAALDLIRRLASPPAVFITASATGYYGDGGEAVLDENAGRGAGFAGRMCLMREARARVAEALRVRTVVLRYGIVLGHDGGALPGLAGPVRFGLGAIMGDGRQWMPWLHIDDAVGLIEHAIDTPGVRGPVNAVAPEPVRTGDFMRTLGTVLNRPVFVRIPAVLLRTTLGEMANLFLDSARAVPAAAQASGYRFRHAGLEPALRDLLKPARRPGHGASNALMTWVDGAQ